MKSTRAIPTIVAAMLLAVFGSAGAAAAADYGVRITEYNLDGRKEQFWVGAGNAVYHRWATAPGGDFASGDHSMGGNISSGVGAIENQDGRLEIFGRWPDGKLAHQWQLQVNGTTGWSGWEVLNGGIKANTGLYADLIGGRIRVKVTGVDNLIHYKWQVAPNGGWEDGWR